MSAQLPALAAQLSGVAAGLLRGEPVAADVDGMVSTVEAEVARLLANQHARVAYVKTLASRVARANSMLARYFAGDTSTSVVDIVGELRGLQHALQMLDQLC